MKTQKLKIKVYRDKRGEFRWNLWRCGKIVGDSAGDGYKRIGSCTKTLGNIIESFQTFNYEWVNPLPLIKKRK